MAQVTIYLDDETAARMRASAKAEGVSVSAWLAELVRDRTRTTWPEEIVDLVGAWSEDFPSAEQLRACEGDDTRREPL